MEVCCIFQKYLDKYENCTRQYGNVVKRGKQRGDMLFEYGKGYLGIIGY